MSPERWTRIKSLFDQSVGLEATERQDFLDLACGTDVSLRAEVESLLSADASADSMLDAPLSQALETIFGSATSVGRRFGSYRVVREIGRGGMAVVFAAQRDDEQFEKQVAIKLIKRGMDTDAIIARFRRERQILARLEHPNIAYLLDGGVSDDGLPYLVMELVEGEPIDAYCDRLALSISNRLRLFRTVCSAVQMAHQNLIVHRDLKPSNILVSPAGIPKLLDFGIAKLLDDVADGPPTNLDHPTVAGLRPMTPEYASPEQIRGEAVTTVSDIYSLGVLLYELLTGHRPLELQRLSPRQVEEAVCERQPLRPSSCLHRPDTLITTEARRIESTSADHSTPQDIVGGCREGSGQRLRRRLQGDLDKIVLKALEKAPHRRYRSAEQLSEDLHRHLRGLPVVARKNTVFYRWSTFVRRHRWGVAAVVLIFLSLVIGLISTAWQAKVAREERERAEWVSQFMVDLFAISHPSKARGESVTVRQVLDRGAERVDRELAEVPRVRAEILRSMGLAYAKLGLFEKAEPLLLEAVELRRGKAGGNHLALMTAINDLGELLTKLARFQEAERLHRQALEGRSRSLDERNEKVVESLNSLAVALFHLHRRSEAETLLRQALDSQGSSPIRDPLLNTTRNNLALVLKSLGRMTEAEAFYRLALTSNRDHLGDDHPEVAINMNNLAEILRTQDHCDQAIGLYESALKLEEKLLGHDHANLAVTLNNYAGCLKDLERWDEAESLYLSALQIRRRALGEDHPAVAATLNNLAEVYFGRGDLNRSEALFREATALNRQIHGEEHADVARNLGNLATVLVARKSYVEAEALYREALEIRRSLGGEKNLAVATQHHNLARLLLRTQRFEEAEEQFGAALGIRQLHLEGDHPAVAQSMFGLAVAASQQGPPRRAEPILRRSLDLWQRGPDTGRVQIAALKSLLGGTLIHLGQLAEAETLLLASEAAKPDQRTRKRLVELYETLGKPDEAEPFREPATP
jgi:serine/threonine-protein kinase